ncbi:MAG: SH3 domain-containing protein [Propionibacteriaceae bacterium]|nr:SH3 domain-containing protein [Propionibacteriaceae bacterium]
MADDKLDDLPARPRRAIEEPETASPETGVSAFRARVEKIALPAVLAAAVGAGLIFGGVTYAGGEGETLTAAPAAPAPVRNADDVSRSIDRMTAAEAAAATPEAELSPDEAEGADAPEPAAADLPAPAAAAEPVRLTGFTPSPKPTRAATSSASAGGSRFATATVNVRAGASASSQRIGSVGRGDSVSVTGRTSNGFTQVTVGGRTGWVSSDYLAKSAPAPARSAGNSTSKAPGSTSAAPRSSSAAPARNGAAAAPAAAAPAAGRSCAPLRGLQPRTEAVHQALCANFPAITSYGGVRADWDVEHPSGRAIDAMTSSLATGNAVADWARANASRYGITEVIWNQRIWTTQRASEGWRAMGDRGSVTANHRDHVHISVR